jgi:hypothetical protein
MVYRKKTTSAVNSKKPQLKKIVFLCAIGIYLLAAGGVFVFLRSRADKPVTLYDGKQSVGTVNGEPFFQEDVDVYALELRAAVAADYGRRYKLYGVGAKFWDTKYGGSTPNETLTKLALRDLVRNMVLIQEARRRGIDTPASYHDLETERANWNTRTDEIVYGPKTLGPAEYNTYRITGIINELKTSLLKKELAPTVDQLRAAYSSLPDELKQSPFRASGSLFKWDGEGPSPEAEIRAALRRGLEPEAVADSLAPSFPGLSQENFEFDSNYISKEDPYEQYLASVLETAVRGSVISSPQEQPKLYYVTEKIGGGILTFEQAPGLGRNKWINDQFELFLDKKVKAAKIKRYK